MGIHFRSEILMFLITEPTKLRVIRSVNNYFNLFLLHTPITWEGHQVTTCQQQCVAAVQACSEGTLHSILCCMYIVQYKLLGSGIWLTRAIGADV